MTIYESRSPIPIGCCNSVTHFVTIAPEHWCQTCRNFAFLLFFFFHSFFYQWWVEVDGALCNISFGFIIFNCVKVFNIKLALSESQITLIESSIYKCLNIHFKQKKRKREKKNRISLSKVRKFCEHMLSFCCCRRSTTHVTIKKKKISLNKTTK